MKAESQRLEHLKKERDELATRVCRSRARMEWAFQPSKRRRLADAVQKANRVDAGRYDQRRRDIANLGNLLRKIDAEPQRLRSELCSSITVPWPALRAGKDDDLERLEAELEELVSAHAETAKTLEDEIRKLNELYEDWWKRRQSYHLVEYWNNVETIRRVIAAHGDLESRRKRELSWSSMPSDVKGGLVGVVLTVTIMTVLVLWSSC